MEYAAPNVIIYNSIQRAQSAAQRAAAEFVTLCNRYNLTQMGAEEERKRIFGKADAEIQAAKDEGAAAVDAAIRYNETLEKEAAQIRAKDTERLQRLNEKIALARTIASDAEIDEGTLEALRVSFSEFENDPLSIAAIRAAVKNSPDMARIYAVIPGDSTGKAKEHCEAFKALMVAAIDAAGAPIRATATETGPNDRGEEVTAFCEYCRRQNEFLSRDPGEVWAEIIKARPDLYIAAGMWSMRFRVDQDLIREAARIAKIS